jgi:hypothetical protein
MTKHLFQVFILFILAGIGFISCKKESDSGVAQLEFSIFLNSSGLKSASVSEASYVVVTIEDASGKVVKISEKLELYNMSGNYITQPISLVSGNYKLTRFLVLDASNNVMYASPLKESASAYLVHEPLPLAFQANTNSVTKLVPQVLAANSNTPESFGYSTFSFNVVETFDFLVGTFIYNETLKNFQLTTASISILSDTVKVYTGELKNQTNGTNITLSDSMGITNKITLPATYNQYTLNISKPGYKTYIKTFTRDELKLHYRSADKGPLVVVLDKAIPQQDTSFYIRGNFGNEYLNFSCQQIPGHCCTYYMYYKNGTFSHGEFQIVAYESTKINGSRWIGLYSNGVPGVNGIHMDDMVLPYNYKAPGTYVWTDIQYYPYSNGSADHYFAITRGTNLVVTIESIANDIIYGKFSGTPALDSNGSVINVSGEFHGKFNRVRIDY